MKLPTTLEAIEAMLAEWEPRLRELRRRRGYIKIAQKLRAQRGDPAYRQHMREVAARRSRSLPPMSEEQRYTYDKLRRNGISRDEALRTLRLPARPSPATGPAADALTLPRAATSPAHLGSGIND